jgi:hypothetical protein
VESGYFYEAISGSIIDRYNGSLLTSTDMQTRIPIGEFVRMDYTPRSAVQVRNATSWAEVRRIVEEIEGSRNRKLVFRGQIENYLTSWPVPNPNFVISGIGEISLPPSLWRRKLRTEAVQLFGLSESVASGIGANCEFCF